MVENVNPSDENGNLVPQRNGKRGKNKAFKAKVGRWKPGESGNPKGPGRIIRFTDRLHALLAMPDSDPTFATRLDRLCNNAINYACDGDAKFAALILDRVDPATRYRVSMNVNSTVTPESILAHLRGLGATYTHESLPPSEPAIIDVSAKEVASDESDGSNA